MKYKRTQEIRNENRAKVGIEDGGWRERGIEGKHWICWLMKDGIRNCSILVLGILGVSVQVLGMNSRHYSFRSLVYNCIFHLSTG